MSVEIVAEEWVLIARADALELADILTGVFLAERDTDRIGRLARLAMRLDAAR